jgi:hypothetical protein
MVSFERRLDYFFADCLIHADLVSLPESGEG